MLTSLKHINYIKCLGWSIKVKLPYLLQGSAEFDTLLCLTYHCSNSLVVSKHSVMYSIKNTNFLSNFALIFANTLQCSWTTVCVESRTSDERGQRCPEVGG